MKKKTFQINQRVRILPVGDDNHPNAYGRITEIDEENSIVFVTNMNMPYQGTFSREPFRFDEVE